MKRTAGVMLLPAFALLSSWASLCWAAWPSTASGNLPVAAVPGTQDGVSEVMDGEGGWFFVWEDARDSAATGFDMYAQHLDASGHALWTAGGVPVAIMPGDQAPSGYNAAILVPDGQGGLFVGFDTNTQSPVIVRIQRLSTSGTPMWGDSGVAISDVDGQQDSPRMLPDSQGGLFVAWSGYTLDNTQSVRAQRLDASGARQWGAEGVIVCTSVVPQAQEVVSDGSGGIIVVWQDYRAFGYGQIFAQRVNGDGASAWTPNGIPVCDSPVDQEELQAASDGSGGALLTWTNLQAHSANVIVQRISTSGSLMWTAEGIPVSTAAAWRSSSQLVSDASGGAIVAWTEQPGPGQDIFAQRIGANGLRKWGDAAVPVCSLAGDQRSVVLVPDGSGGAILGWPDHRSGSGWDIYAQLVDSTGVPRWTPNGVAVSTATGDQDFPAIASDGVGGACLAWEDHRSDACDIYAQTVRHDGTLGGSVLQAGSNTVQDQRVILDEPRPNPAGSRGTSIRYVLPTPSRARLSIFDLGGRLVRVLADRQLEAGIHEQSWDGECDDGEPAPAGLYLLKLESPVGRATRKLMLVR